MRFFENAQGRRRTSEITKNSAAEIDSPSSRVSGGLQIKKQGKIWKISFGATYEIRRCFRDII